MMKIYYKSTVWGYKPVQNQVQFPNDHAYVHMSKYYISDLLLIESIEI